jgi:hypothetical protein
MLLTPRGEKVYGAIEGKVRAEIGMADLSFEHALVYRELGTTEEAIRLLDVGYRVIEKFSPDMLRLLAAMATFSRMVSAIAPVQPLRPKNFRWCRSRASPTCTACCTSSWSPPPSATASRCTSWAAASAWPPGSS